MRAVHSCLCILNGFRTTRSHREFSSLARASEVVLTNLDSKALLTCGLQRQELDFEANNYGSNKIIPPKCCNPGRQKPVVQAMPLSNLLCSQVSTSPSLISDLLTSPLPPSKRPCLSLPAAWPPEIAGKVWQKMRYCEGWRKERLVAQCKSGTQVKAVTLRRVHGAQAIVINALSIAPCSAWTGIQITFCARILSSAEVFKISGLQLLKADFECAALFICLMCAS